MAHSGHATYADECLIEVKNGHDADVTLQTFAIVCESDFGQVSRMLACDAQNLSCGLRPGLGSVLRANNSTRG